MTELWSGYRSSYDYGACERNNKLEIVKGNVFSAKQTYSMTQTRSSPDLPPIPLPPRASKNKENSSSLSSKKKKKAWSLNDPEIKRRTRVAKYKYYAVEGKVKSSFRKGFRWIKKKCANIVHGF